MKKVDIEKAMKFRHPEIVVNVVTKSKERRIDITPIGWAMLGSSKPSIDGSLACYECKLIKMLETSDHTIFLGEIVAASVSGKDQGLINLGHSRLVKLKRGKDA